MRFSIRDLAISTALLSFYLAVLTRLWRELLSRGQETALIGAGGVLTLVLVQLGGDELRHRTNPGRLLRVYRPQDWRWHYAIAAPVVTLGVAALVVPFNGFWTMITLYLVLCAFSVHLFVCLTPLVSFTTRGVTANHKKWAWDQRRVRLLEADTVENGKAPQLQIATDKPITLPADRVEEVDAILRELAPTASESITTPQGMASGSCNSGSSTCC